MQNTLRTITSHTNNETLKLSIKDYPGGVAVWGALPAVFDTSNQGFDRGVHVHARKTERSPKNIDATYDRVLVEWQERLFEIDECSAIHFTMASIFDIKINSLNCINCHTNIISSGIYAVIPTDRHSCQVCGTINETNESCIINPIVDLKIRMGDPLIKRKSCLPNRSITLDAERFPGGIQIWGSNPSILWTAKRLEESAIHVHAYNASQKRVVDNTYSKVIINGEYLDIEMIRVLQIQLAVPDLMKAITTVSCPYCGIPQFDEGIHAVVARSERNCHACKNSFESQKCISNPSLNHLQTIQENGVYA